MRGSGTSAGLADAGAAGKGALLAAIDASPGMVAVDPDIVAAHATNWRGWFRGDALALARWGLGGTVSAEHGIGQLHRHEMRGQKSAAELDLMWAIERSIDRRGVLNPCQLLPPPAPA